MRSLKRLRPFRRPLWLSKFANFDFLLGLMRGGLSGLWVGDLSPTVRLLGRLVFAEDKGP